jgi:hypothetical protein
LTGRQILLRFHERSTTHFVAQIQAPPSTCSARTAAPAVTRSWAANRAARKVCRLEFAGEKFCEVRAATKALSSEASLFTSNLHGLPQTFAVCLKSSLFALYYALGNQRRGVPTPVSRLEQTLNKPKVVLVVGVLAVALNVLLYFGLFLPRMTPLITHINPIGTSLPEAISKSDPEASSNSHPEDSSKSNSEVNSKSGSEASSESDSGASIESGSEASGKSVPEESLASETDSSPDSSSGSPPESSTSPQSPAGSPPELPPLPTPSQGQYE